MSPDPALLSLNTATVKAQWTLAQAIDGCARHGIRGIAPWRDKLAEMGLRKAVSQIKSHDLTVTGLCRGGFFTARDWLDDNRRAIEEAHALEADCLVLVVGGLPEGSKDLDRTRERVKESISMILPEARAAGVPLAIEPLHPMQAAERACINTLEQALDICDALGDGIGVAVDVYHALSETGKLSAIALFCVGTASAFGWLLAYYQIPKALLANVTSWGMGITGVGFFIAFCFLVVGCFLDAIPAIIIVGTILQPLAASVGMHPIHFAIIGIVSLAFGLVTPPYGLCLMIACHVAKVPLRFALKDTLIMLVPMLLMLAAIIIWPEFP